MKIIKSLLILFLFLPSCMSASEVLFMSKDNNVCRTLKGKVVLYAIFVDSQHTCPWTEYDINSTLDSISKSMQWVMASAKSNNIPLDIIIDYHKNPNGIIPISNNFQKKTLSATLNTQPLHSGIKSIYRWADKIAATAGKSYPADSSKVIQTENKLNDRERLIAKLRDIHKTDNVALIYFINNYYQEEISVAIDTQSETNVEFAIVSFKSPSVIAHEFLHLFGAWDLYVTPYDKKRKNKKKKKLAMEYFPNEIMAFTYRNIDSLQIGDFTKYLIGWKSEIPADFNKLLLGKKLKPAKY